MRRGICATFILLFWLGPLAAIVPTRSESRLPACCRRNGTHHCAISEALAAQLVRTGSAPMLAAPVHCSSYPACMLATTGPVEALVVSPVTLLHLLATAHSPAASRAAARLSELRTRANRGPPVPNLG